MDTTAVYEALAGKMNLSEDDQLELLPSGRQAVHKNRIGWAHDRLKRSGYAGSPKRGLWQITDAGGNYVKSHPKALKAEEIGAIADVSRDSRLSPGEEPGNKPASALLPAITESPDERIAKAVAEVRDSVRRDLPERIGQGPRTAGRSDGAGRVTATAATHRRRGDPPHAHRDLRPPLAAPA
jgi:restriction system protein